MTDTPKTQKEAVLPPLADKLQGYLHSFNSAHSWGRVNDIEWLGISVADVKLIIEALTKLSAREEELAQLESQRDFAGMILGKICVYGTLINGEKPVDPPPHAAVDAILAQIKRAETAETLVSKLAAIPVATEGESELDIPAWCRNWFHDHRPASREDFDLPSLLRDFARTIAATRVTQPKVDDGEAMRRIENRLVQIVADARFDERDLQFFENELAALPTQEGPK